MGERVDIDALENLARSVPSVYSAHVLPLCAELRELRAAHGRLLDDLVTKVSAATMLTGIRCRNGGMTMGLEGGMAHVMAEMLAHDFTVKGGINYVEFTFTSQTSLPGESFVVTTQRVAGKTPHQLRAEAESRVRELEAAIAETERLRDDADFDRRTSE